MRSFWLRTAVSVAAFLPSAFSIQFNPDDEASIKSACATYAQGLMSHYKNNASGTAAEDIGIFPKPHYWWEAGAAWGGMIEYTTLTGDSSYTDTLIQALVANTGPKKDIILPWRKDQEGNDDQAFWALAFMSALEYQFKNPKQSDPQYLEVVTNAFENIVSRWNTTNCGGGLKWQIYPENTYGYNYKNSVSNGATFALATRLARYTGDQKYVDWAEKIWDWSEKIGLISDKFEVFDGADENKACAEKDHTEWTYNLALYLHGAAGLYDFTKGSDVWKQRTSGLLDHAQVFFRDGVMYEATCETGEDGRKPCNLDQQSFKAYLGRWMAKTALLAPFTKDKITKYLRDSAVAAAKSCSGGDDHVTCGSKWYTGAWDGSSGVGQQLSALEITQALLLLKQARLPAVASAPSGPSTVSSNTPTPSSTPSSQAPVSSGAATSTDIPVSSTPVSGGAGTTKPAPSIGSAPQGGIFAPSSVDSGVASPTGGSSAYSTGSVETSAVGGTPSSKKCDCGTSTVTVRRSTSSDCGTLTITVRPTSAPSASAGLPTPYNSTAVFTPTPSTTGPLLHTGAAVNAKMVGSGSILGSLILAILAVV